MAIDNQQRSTIYELSKKAGLSVSTISAVLSGTWSRRGISARTAEAVKALAKAHNYMPNKQAQGLRKSVSQMTGLMIPSHNSRFFAAVAQSFELNVRRRGKCPIVVSAGRDPATERETAKTLISYSIEGLVICGAADPDGVHEICSSAGQRHVNIDLPGSKVSSVISDNFNGGLTLTSAIIETGNKDGLRANDIHFLGDAVRSQRSIVFADSRSLSTTLPVHRPTKSFILLAMTLRKHVKPSRRIIRIIAVSRVVFS